MQKIRLGLILFWILVCAVTPAAAQVSIGIGLPNVSIGINLPIYPDLDRVPGYPVYYAPRVDANYFYYDGMYWVYQNDNWYASSWYNGPWGFVGPESVPLYILRIPVSYYRQPPVYFRGWQSNAAPRWGQHWGRDWEQRRRGWDKWKRSSTPSPAPLPVYQRQYAGDRYPRVEQQQGLHKQNFRYQPRDKVVRQHFQQVKQQAPAPAHPQRGKQEMPAMRNPNQQDGPHAAPVRQGGYPGPQPQHQRGERIQNPAPAKAPPPQQRAPAAHEQKQQANPAAHEQRQQPAAAQHEQQAPRAHGQEQRPQGRGEAQEPNRGHGQGQNRDEERGRGRDN